MGIKKVLILLIVCTLQSSFANSFIQYADFINLSKAEQYKIIDKLQDYLTELEHNRDRVKTKKYSSIENLLNKFKAYAQDTPIAQSQQSCVYGGWTSLEYHNLCANPRKLSPSKYSYRESALTLRDSKYDSDAIKIAKLNGDSYNELEEAYLKGEEFVNVMPVKGKDGFLEVELNRSAKKGSENSCDLRRGDVFCNPAVFGKLNGKALCVPGDRDHQAYNSSFLCNKAVKNLKSNSPDEYKELMNSIVKNAQTEPGKTLFIQNLYSMYDLCICNGAASNFLNKDLADRMYNSRTCIGLMEQSNEVYTYVSDNKCSVVYQDATVGGLKDWTSFAATAYDQVSSELFDLRESIDSKIGNYKNIDDFRRSAASEKMNRDEEALLEKERDKKIESRPLPSNAVIKICREIKPAPIADDTDYTLSITPSDINLKTKKLTASITPVPEVNLGDTSWKLLGTENQTPLVKMKDPMEATINLINSKKPYKVLLQTSVEGELIEKEISIPNYQLKCELDVKKASDTTYSVGIKLMLGEKDFTKEWIENTKSVYSIENVKDNIITSEKELEPFTISISKKGHEDVVCSYKDAKIEDGPKLTIKDITPEDAKVDAARKLEANIEPLPKKDTKLVYTWDLPNDQENKDIILSPIPGTNQVNVKRYNRKEPHMVLAQTTLNKKVIKSELFPVKNYQIKCTLEVTKGEKETEGSFDYTLTPKLSVDGEDFSSWVDDKTKAEVTEGIKSEDNKFTISAKEEPTEASITYKKDRHEDVICSLQSSVDDLVDLDTDDTQDASCSVAITHADDKLDVDIKLDGKSLNTKELFSKSGLTFSLYRITEESSKEDKKSEEATEEMVGDTPAEKSSHAGQLQTNNPFDISIQKGSKDIILKAYIEGSGEVSCLADSGLTIKAVQEKAKSTYTPPPAGQAPPARQRQGRFSQGRL